MKICAVCMFVGLSVYLRLFVLLYVNESLVSGLSLLYLSVLRARPDRADVDNYKVFSQRANFGDVCLHLPLALRFFLIVLFFLPPSSLLLRLSRISRNHNTTDPKYNLQVHS